MGEKRNVDPRTLRPHPSRLFAEPSKLHRKIAEHGTSTAGMAPIEVYEGSDGTLVIFNGITRATRIATLAPGTLVPVEIIGRLATPQANRPSLGDLLK